MDILVSIIHTVAGTWYHVSPNKFILLYLIYWYSVLFNNVLKHAERMQIFYSNNEKWFAFLKHSGPLLHALLLLRRHDWFGKPAASIISIIVPSSSSSAEIGGRETEIQPAYPRCECEICCIIKYKNDLKLFEEMFFSSSQQPIEYTSAPISCKLGLVSCRLVLAGVSGFVCAADFSLY